MSAKVFISYAAEDEGKLSDFKKKLQEHQTCFDQAGPMSDFIDFNIKESEDPRVDIKRNIAQADTVMVLWTPAAARSNTVNYEAGMADALGKKLTFVQIGQNPPNIPINLQGADIQVIDFKDSLATL